MSFVGKCYCKIAHFTRQGPVFLHGVVVFDRKGLLSLPLHARIELKKCCMGRDTPTRGRLKMHEWAVLEGVKWGHFGDLSDPRKRHGWT